MMNTTFPTSYPTSSPSSFCATPLYSEKTPSCDNSVDMLKAIFIYPSAGTALGLLVAIFLVCCDASRLPMITRIWLCAGFELGTAVSVLRNLIRLSVEKSCNHMASSKNYATAAWVDFALFVLVALLALYRFLHIEISCQGQNRLCFPNLRNFFGNNDSGLNQKLMTLSDNNIDPEAGVSLGASSTTKETDTTNNRLTA